MCPTRQDDACGAHTVPAATPHHSCACAAAVSCAVGGNDLFLHRIRSLDHIAHSGSLVRWRAPSLAVYRASPHNALYGHPRPGTRHPLGRPRCPLRGLCAQGNPSRVGGERRGSHKFRRNIPRPRRGRLMDITLPHNGWLPRGHQMALWNYLQAGGRRAMAVWHRRAGKDEICLHHASCAAFKRTGNYWHCLPEFLQGRKAIWTAINAHTGKRRIDEAFPPVIRETINDNEMFIRFINGSTWQIIGSDRYDATVGAGVAGITYSEWALANPSAWAYHRPMLAENNGWAAFITTPRGHNHAKSMYDHAKSSKDWFCELLTAQD